MARNARAVADINITPLIDVMLVLLVIFMLVTPVARHGLDATVAQRDSSVTPGPRPVVLIVERAAFLLDGMPVSGSAELEGRLRYLVAPRNDKTVFVRASSRLFRR